MPSYMQPSYRSFSYPPSIHGVDFESLDESHLPDIDDEPFAHFLTPLSEDDLDDPYSFNAGISDDGPRTTKSSKFKSNVADKWARYVKQNHTPLHSQYHGDTIYEDDEEEDEEESFMSLDDDRLYDVPQAVTHINSTSPRNSIFESSSGRDQDLMSRKVYNRRRHSRTLSGHRHSWREPSPDLFTVDESEEEEMPVVRRPKTRKPKEGAERRRSSTRSRSRHVSERSKL